MYDHLNVIGRALIFLVGLLSLTRVHIEIKGIGLRLDVTSILKQILLHFQSNHF